MIKSITSLLKNVGSKLLIIIIALSFAVWGIGDIFVSNSSNPTVAEVGKHKIKLNEFQLDYQLLIDRLRQSNNEPITEDFIKAIGLHHNVVDNLIKQKYIKILAENLRLEVSDKYVKKAIINNPLFNDELGVFSKDYYNYYLNRNNLKENDIYDITKDAISNDLLIQSLTHSQFLPLKIAKNVALKRDLVRKADLYKIDTSAMLISDDLLTEKSIKDKYEKVKSNFLIPESRNIKIISFLYKNEEKKINVTEQDIKSFYNDNIEVFTTNETREVYFVQFDKEEKLKDFIKFSNQYEDFFKALEAFGLDKTSSFIGNIEEKELPSETSNIVFNLKEKDTSKLIKSPFGYKTFYVDKINKKETLPFNKVKDTIRKDFMKEKTNEQIYKKANIFYEGFLENTNLNQALENLISIVKPINNIDLNNIKNVSDFNKFGLSNNALAKIIFDLRKNDISEVIEDKDNNLHYLYLDQINPAKEKSFDAIKEDIINILYSEERDRRARKMINEFKSSFKNRTLAKKYKNKYFSYESTDWVTLDDRLGKSISKQIKDLIFSTKLNSLSEHASSKKGVFMIVIPYQQSKEELKGSKKTNLEDVKYEINNSIESDLNQAIIYELTKNYKSKINQNFLNSF